MPETKGQEGVVAMIHFQLSSDPEVTKLPDGTEILQANAKVLSTIGPVTPEAGDTIDVLFTPQWVGPVEGCHGIAEEIDGRYKVQECQDLSAGIEF